MRFYFFALEAHALFFLSVWEDTSNGEKVMMLKLNKRSLIVTIGFGLSRGNREVEHFFNNSEYETVLMKSA